MQRLQVLRFLLTIIFAAILSIGFCQLPIGNTKQKMIKVSTQNLKEAPVKKFGAKPLTQNNSTAAKNQFQPGNQQAFKVQDNCLDSSFSKQYSSNEFGGAYTSCVITAKNGDIIMSGACNNVKGSNIDYYYGYIVRLDKNGNIKWMKRYYNETIDFFNFYKLYETDNNELIVIGDLTNNVNYKVDSNYSTVILKLTEDGDITWTKSFNSHLFKRKNCSAAAPVIISSISQGLNNDLIFCSTTIGCESPTFSTVFILDKYGNIKWDANFSSGNTKEGISAVLYQGNILTVSLDQSFFSNNPDGINLIFQTLDYKTGTTLSSKSFKADYSYPELFYKQFDIRAAQLQVGNNGHFYIAGAMTNTRYNDGIHNEMFAFLEFDHDLSFVKGTAIGTNELSTNAQISSGTSIIKVSPSGDIALNWVKHTSFNEQEIFFANIVNGQVIKSRKIYQHTSIGIFADLWLNANSSLLYLSSYQNTNAFPYEAFMVLRKQYPSDTTQTECSGIDTPFTFFDDLKYVENPQFHMQDSSSNSLYIIDNNFLAYNENIFGEDLCKSQSVCDSIKIHGQLDYCGANPDVILTAYKNKECGAGIAWIFDTSAISKIEYPNDTTLNIKFKQDWSGKIFAKTSGSACAFAVIDSAVVNVQSTKTVLDLGADTILCIGDSLVINAGNYNKYTWQNGSDDSLFVVKQAGKYYVDVTDFCSNNYSDTINVTSAIVPPFSIGNDTIVCVGDTLRLSASTGFVKYSWSSNNVINIDKGYAAAIVNQDELIFANATTNDGCTTSDSINVTTTYARSIALGNDTSFCDYDSVILNAGDGYKSYQWNNGSTAQTTTVDKTGNYIVTAKDVNDCFASDSLQIMNVYAHPVPDLGNDKNICDGSSITLNAGSYFTYNWNDGSSSQYLKIVQPGSYWVTVTDNNYCMGSDTFVVSQVLQPPSKFLPSVDSLCYYDKLTLQPSGSFATYSWSTGEMQPTITVDKPGFYTLNVTGYNGCNGTSTTDVAEKDCMHGVYIPTAFTPNSDGKNDVFRAMVFGKVIYFSFNIYDRFGELIFSTHDPSKGWNGFINGQPQNTGTYIWQCAYQLDGTDAKFEKGTVILMH